MSLLDEFDLTGQVAIITGAGSGLGREMALALADAGCDIVGAGRRVDPIEETGEMIRAKGRRYLACGNTDVTNSEHADQLARRAAAEMGHISILINNAGGGTAGRGKAFTELTDEDWRSGMDTNLTSAFYCSRAVIPYLLENGHGRIINITSGWGFRGGRNNFMYPISKGGVIQLTKALAMTYARDGIRVTCIAPGQFPKTDDETLKAQIGAKQPIGRAAELHEIGPLAVLLCSGAVDYMSGETIVIDGGTIAAGITPAGVFPRAAG